jgi:aminopeptidase N
MSKTVKRLYEQFQPETYRVHIIPSDDKKSFTGTVTVTGKKTGRPSERITLHQKDLTIYKATLHKHGKDGQQEVAVERVNTQATYDEVRVHSTELLYPGTYTVSLEFSGTVTDAMHGLYPCRFQHDGEQKQLLATQFESHHAREVFPCVDEPEAKAIFSLTLTSPTNEVVLANTPILTQETVDQTLVTTFEDTPIMSTYLLAFVIGELHSVEATTRDGVLMRTWATVAQPAETLRYANDEAVRLLEFYNDYFQTPFPLKKCDQVALPDFEAGAMENWGLITYREIALLVDPNNRAISSEQYVSLVVAHELSHQWFGNLVTMKWWDDLWLNESFASLMEHIALNALHPDWNQWEQYTAMDVISCSSRDVFKDVQSVHVEVKHPDEIGTLFDPAIVYAKGGRLLKMMREFIGDDAFREALKAYFTDHAYKNTVGDDLWQAMSATSGKDVKGLMDPWLDQSGMPVLDVEQSDTDIKLSQKRFVLDTDEDTHVWPIPLLSDSQLESDLFHKTTVSLKKSSSKPVLFNINGSGHFLVNYRDTATQRHIAESFGKQTLNASSRITTLNDHLLLARRGDAPLSDALDIVASASSEPREAVWSIMARTMAVAMQFVEDDESTQKRIKAFRAELAKPWYEKLGWNDEPTDDPNTINLRHTILALLSASNYEPVVAEAKKRYNEAKNVSELPAEQRGIIAGVMVKSGEPIIDDLINEYKSTPNPEVQLSISSALTSTKDQAVIQKIIDEAFGPDGFVRPQDVFRWFAYLMRNHHSREAMWNWFTQNWDYIEEQFGSSKSLDHFVIYSAGPISTRDMQKKFDDFFVPKLDMVAIHRNILIAQSEIEARVTWREREQARITAYFSK